MDRRTILKGGSAVAAASVASATIAAASPITIPAKWDFEADFVVVGSGTGLAGALAAAVNGRDVLVLEKAARPGGSTALAGMVWSPNNRIAKAAGLLDSRAMAREYLLRVARGKASDALIDTYLNESPRLLDFLEQHTAIRLEVGRGPPTGNPDPITESHPHWPGGVLLGRELMPTLTSRPVHGAGEALIGGLSDALAAKGGRMMLNTAARRLVTRLNADGKTEVLGVHAEVAGKSVAIRARRGVLLAAGGFDRNEEMKRHFLKGIVPEAIGVPGLTGDGIKMAQAIGADLRNVTEAWWWPVYKALSGGPRGGMACGLEKSRPGSIVVNRRGERFGNEASDCDSFTQTMFGLENWGLLENRNAPAWLVFDDRCLRRYGIDMRPPGAAVSEWVVSAPTIGELADKLGIDSGGLSATLVRFNADAARGKDNQFHRGDELYDQVFSDWRVKGVGATLSPLVQAPFHAVEIAVGILGTAGGVSVNPAAQALDPFGDVIERLYAAGANSGAGAPGGGVYPGGGGPIGVGLTFSFIAGNHAAALKPWR